MTEEGKRLVELLRDEDNCNVLDYIDDAADMIESLSAQLEQVEKERDVAINDLYYVGSPYGEFCSICKYSAPEECEVRKREHDHCWEWRGVEVE